MPPFQRRLPPSLPPARLLVPAGPAPRWPKLKHRRFQIGRVARRCEEARRPPDPPRRPARRKGARRSAEPSVGRHSRQAVMLAAWVNLRTDRRIGCPSANGGASTHRSSRNSRPLNAGSRFPLGPVSSAAASPINATTGSRPRGTHLFNCWRLPTAAKTACTGGRTTPPAAGRRGSRNLRAGFVMLLGNASSGQATRRTGGKNKRNEGTAAHSLRGKRRRRTSRTWPFRRAQPRCAANERKNRRSAGWTLACSVRVSENRSTTRTAGRIAVATSILRLPNRPVHAADGQTHAMRGKSPCRATAHSERGNMPDWRDFVEDDGNRTPPLTLRPFSSPLPLRQGWGNLRRLAAGVLVWEPVISSSDSD